VAYMFLSYQELFSRRNYCQSSILYSYQRNEAFQITGRAIRACFSHSAMAAKLMAREI